MESKKILIIEDDKLVRENIFEILEAEGFTVVQAKDGVEGIFKAKQELPDLVLSDIAMPHVDGFQVIELLKTDKLTERIPFIFLSAKAELSDLKKGLRFGADDYLTKPFTKSDLLSAIELRLHKHELVTSEMKNLRENIINSLPHEFRTPLTAISGFAEIIRTEIDTLTRKDILEFITYIIAGADRLKGISENFILLSLLETIKDIPEEIEELRNNNLSNIPEMLLKSGTSIALRLGRHSDIDFCAGTESCLSSATINCTKTMKSKDASAYTDVTIRISSNYFTRVIEELISNALKFSKESETVKICYFTNNNNFVISISNPNSLILDDKILTFGALMQINRKKYEQQGVGLGLALAQRIVSLTGGALDVETKNGLFSATIIYPVAK